MIKKGLKLEFTSSEIHSFDAYYKNVILIENTLIIPYINLGLFNEQESPIVKYIDRCYVLVQEISYLNLYEKGVIIDKPIEPAKYEIFFGGKNLTLDSIFIDIDIKCNKGGIYFLADTEISEEMWIPIDTPNFKRNMPNSKVLSLFNYSDCIISLNDIL